ncbi:MAG: hypothetical protein ACKOW9_06275 [Candidatus Paceibacterota bacterium]
MSKQYTSIDEFGKFSRDTFGTLNENNAIDSFSATTEQNEDASSDGSASEPSLNDASSKSSSVRKANGFTYMLVGSIIGGGLFFTGSTEITHSAKEQYVKDSSALVSSVLVEAAAYHDYNGTFTGFKPSVEVLHASGGPYFLVATGEGADCSYSGIIPNQDVVIKKDPTGEKCKPELMAELALAFKGL